MSADFCVKVIPCVIGDPFIVEAPCDLVSSPGDSRGDRDHTGYCQITLPDHCVVVCGQTKVYNGQTEFT